MEHPVFSSLDYSTEWEGRVSVSSYGAPRVKPGCHFF